MVKPPFFAIKKNIAGIFSLGRYYSEQGIAPETLWQSAYEAHSRGLSSNSVIAIIS